MQSLVRNLNETYEATPASVAKARSQLAEFAGAAGAAPNQIDAVRLAASEAVTNCVLHGYRGDTGKIHLNAAVVADELWVMIADGGRGLGPRSDRPGLGLGLGLISQVCDDFDIVSRASGGTEVRIRFNLGEDSSDSSLPRPHGDRWAGSSPDRNGFAPSLTAV